jgi:hypothetical protein
VTPDTSFLCYVVAWFALLVAGVCGLACLWVRRGERAGWVLSYGLGAWWVAIGLGIFFAFGRAEHLLADTLKGLLIVGAAWASRKGTLA